MSWEGNVIWMVISLYFYSDICRTLSPLKKEEKIHSRILPRTLLIPLFLNSVYESLVGIW